MHTNRIINGHFNTTLKMIEHATFFYCHTPILFDQGVKRLIDLTDSLFGQHWDELTQH